MADVEMIADDLEEEFRKLCGEDQPASLQACDRVRKAVNNIEEEASRQRCELEELAEVKKRLAEREAELLRLRQQVELPMGTVKESAAEEHPGWLRRQRIQGKDDDSRAQDSEQMGSPRADGVEKDLNREEQWKSRGEDRSKLVVIPEVLRALRRVRGLQDTKIFFYWSWRDLHPGNTALFGSRVKHVVLVLPPEDAGVGSWTAFADALGMWLAGGCHVYLVAGPRTGNDKSWFRVAEKARECVNMYIRPPCRTRIVDKLPTESEAADVKAPCFAMGIIADIDVAVSEHQARVFYAGCAQQLAPWVRLELLPERRPRTEEQRHRQDRGVGPAIREGRVSKRKSWRRRQDGQPGGW